MEADKEKKKRWLYKMKMYTEITISDSFRGLIQGHKYEEYILNIINKSKKIIHGLPFTAVLSQSNGESDFIDNNGRRYDAKLLLNTKQGQLIGDPKNTFEEWLRVMTKERGEFADSIAKRDLSFVENTKFYKIMKERIEDLDSKENGILFIPFPIVNDLEGNIFFNFLQIFFRLYMISLKMKRLLEKGRYTLYIRVWNLINTFCETAKGLENT